MRRLVDLAAPRALAGAGLSGTRLSDARLSGAQLSGAQLSDAQLSGAQLSGAQLSGAQLSGAQLSGAQLSGARLSDARLSDARLSDAQLSDAQLSDAQLSGAQLSGAQLSGARLSGARLSDAQLSGARLSDARLSDARLSDARLSGTRVSDARLSGTRLSDALLPGTRLFTVLSGVLLSATMLVGAACTSDGRGTTPKTEPPLEVRTYGPLGMKADAKLPHQAVILGTDDKNGSTVLPLVQGTGNATVDATFVKRAEKASDVVGGLSPVKLATRPNAELGKRATGPTAEPVKGATESTAEPVKGATGSTAEPVKGATGSTAEPAMRATGPNAEPVKPATGPNAEPVKRATGPTAEPAMRATGPNTEPARGATGPNAEPARGATGPNAEPARGATGPNAEPAMRATGPNAERAMRATGPNAEPAKLATELNAVSSVHVGMSKESVAAGVGGAQWRAGVWASAFVAATTLNKDLTDLTFSATCGGYVDGMGASGLLAVGFLAAATGAQLDEEATMTGIVNPDGTLGPVVGIPERVAAAIDKGKKRVGYPIGMRQAKSMRTGEAVDVEAYAKSRGAQAFEVADVYAGYKLLTGKTLPEPVAVAESEMELPSSTQAAITDRYKAWQQKVATEWAAILQLESAGRLPSLLVYLRDQSKTYAETAEALYMKDRVAPAYVRMVTAWAYASSANQIYDVLAKVRAGKLDDAVATLTALGNLDATTAAVFEKIGTMKPRTIGDALEMVEAFRAALRGWAFEVFASKTVATTTAYVKGLAGIPAAQLGSPQTADALIAMVAPTVLYAKRTVSETTLATEELLLDVPTDVDYTALVPDVRRLAASFSSAGGAGLDYLDALVVQPLTESAKISADEARHRVAIREPDYLVALQVNKLGSADGIMKELREKWSETWGDQALAWGMLALAGGELAYFHTAELIAKYDSFGVTAGDSGQVTAIEHEKAFSKMLAIAERNARANARAAKIATGTIPVQALLAYQLAVVERDGSLAEKLDALSQFWTSSAVSQTAVMLARN